jgi:fumarate reductase flavoprotein subunit
MGEFDYSVPVLVAGGGACGAVAALAAHDAGAEVLVIEQDDPPMGSTAMSQGLICAAGTAAQRALDIDDSPEVFFADIMAKTRGQTDPDLAHAIAHESGLTIDWLIDQHQLPYELDLRFRPSYGHSRSRVHGWIGRSGVDLIQFLHHRLNACAIDVLLGARLIEIVEGDNGRAAGVVMARPNGALERVGCDTLIVATSGFAANHDMVARYMPEMATARYHGHEGNKGAGIECGARLGGALADMGSYQGYGMLVDPHGIALPPGQIVEGGVLLNAKGERFVDEIKDIAGMVHPVLAQPGGFAWAVYDAAIEERCAYNPETQQLIALRAAKSADTNAELAAIIGVAADTIDRVMTDARLAQAEQRPDQTGRVWGGDRPPEPPYRTLKVRGALFHTQGGLQIDQSARVLRPDGSALPNLFAGGGAARGVSGPSFWGYLPAMGLCTAVTFGRIAGRSAARAHFDHGRAYNVA